MILFENLNFNISITVVVVTYKDASFLHERKHQKDFEKIFRLDFKIRLLDKT